MPETTSPEPPSEPDRELDAFLQAEVQEGRRVRHISPHRTVLTVGVILALGWLAADGVDELLYHSSDPEKVVIADAVGAPASDLEPGTWVELTGVLGNKAATINGLRPGSFRRGPIQVRQLLGSPVFIEFDQEALYERYQPFTRVTVEGRLVDFGPEGDLEPVRRYFQEKFLMEIPEGSRLLIVGEVPGEMPRYPLLFGLFLLVALTSVFFLVRSYRPQIVED